MALNKNGMDLKAIARDQKAIDALPNKGRVQTAKEGQTKAIMAKMSAQDKEDSATKSMEKRLAVKAKGVSNTRNILG